MTTKLRTAAQSGSAGISVGCAVARARHCGTCARCASCARCCRPCSPFRRASASWQSAHHMGACSRCIVAASSGQRASGARGVRGSRDLRSRLGLNGNKQWLAAMQRGTVSYTRFCGKYAPFFCLQCIACTFHRRKKPAYPGIVAGAAGEHHVLAFRVEAQVARTRGLERRVAGVGADGRFVARGTCALRLWRRGCLRYLAP